jgi:outer membrane protein assembly factor BamB
VRPAVVLLAASLALVVGAGGRDGLITGWLSYGGDAARTGAIATPVSGARHWLVPLDGHVTSQPLVADDVPVPGATTVFVATSAGTISAFAPNGQVRWSADVGQHSRPCSQLTGYGVSGTPAIDPETHALYAADPFGRLHALDLATGKELDGWPVRVIADFDHEHVYGGLLVLRDHVYVPVAALCDNPSQGQVVRVSTQTRAVDRWIAVPRRLGGGGGIWGFGGLAYSARRDSLFVATGNALRGGRNVGRRFREWAGYGERLVELSPDLRVRASSHPRDVRQTADLDFSSSPVVFTPPGCRELVGAVNKNGTLYAWRADRVRVGPVWKVNLRSRRTLYPAVIGQPAYSPRHRALFVTTGSQLVKVGIGAGCRPRIAWRLRLAQLWQQGSPTVAGDLVWLSAAGEHRLLGVDARTGRIRRREPLGGDAYAAPAAVDGSLFVATFRGALHGFVGAGAVGDDGDASASFSDPEHGLVTRESGVYATDDGGATWRRAYPWPALRVLRASPSLAVLETGSFATRCGCRTHVRWSGDAGQSWRETRAVRGPFAGDGSALFWHDGRRVYRAAWPLRRSRVVARARGGRIVDLVAVPGGAAALITRRVRGQGWDRAPRVLLVRSGRVATLRLPPRRGAILVRSLEVAWPAIVVHARDFRPAAETAAELAWTSPNGGRTWQLPSAAGSGTRRPSR